MSTHTATVTMWNAPRVEMQLSAKVTPAPKYYSATGYGRKIPTGYMVRFGSRWRRVYVCCISNSGTAYVGKPGAWLATVGDVLPR